MSPNYVAAVNKRNVVIDNWEEGWVGSDLVSIS